MPGHRPKFAIVVLALGVLVALAGAGLIASAWPAIHAARASQDLYVVKPDSWVLPVMFGIGAIGDMAFRRQAQKLGRRAQLIWRMHLSITAALLIVGLVAGAQTQAAWPVLIAILAAVPLMLVTHGAALAAGGLLALRPNNHG